MGARRCSCVRTGALKVLVEDPLCPYHYPQDFRAFVERYKAWADDIKRKAARDAAPDT